MTIEIEDEELLKSQNLSEQARSDFFALSSEAKDGMRDILTQRIPATEELRTLTRQLFDRARRGDGWFLRRQKFEGALIHKCWENALAWAEAHPGDMWIPGFLYLSFGYRFTHVRFAPHVGVLTKAHELLDVTPHDASANYLFLQHAGTDKEFAAAMSNGPMDIVYR